MTYTIKPEIVEGTVLYYRWLKGTVTARNGIEAVVRLEHTAHFYIIGLRDLKDQEGDTWELRPPEQVYYTNVYLDGLGETEHRSINAAFNGTKYGRTRIGIIEERRLGDRVVYAEVHPTEPQLRDCWTDAHNPFDKAAA